MAARRVLVRVLAGCSGRVAAAELRRVARSVLRAEAVPSQVEVEIVLADETTVRDLNRLYRGRDEPTDVLSFASGPPSLPWGEVRGEGEAAPAFIEPPEAPPSLGEVVICLPIAEAQARAAGLPVAGQVAHLLVHGLLHLSGHDHEASEADASRMQAREDELLSALGYAGAYEHGH